MGRQAQALLGVRVSRSSWRYYICEAGHAYHRSWFETECSHGAPACGAPTRLVTWNQYVAYKLAKDLGPPQEYV